MVVKRKSDYLAHHGIKGQSWGDQNGPPYPLDSQVSSAVKKKKSKSFIQKLKDKKKGKKLQAARKKKAEEKKEKEDIINSGDEKRVKKIQNKLTDEEYVRALNRIALNRKLNEIDYSSMEKKLQTIGVLADTVGKVGNAANNVLGAVDKAVGIKDKLTGDPNKSLKTEKESLSLAKDIADLKIDLNSSALKEYATKTKYASDIYKNKENFETSAANRLDISNRVNNQAARDMQTNVSTWNDISNKYTNMHENYITNTEIQRDNGKRFIAKKWNLKDKDEK